MKKRKYEPPVARDLSSGAASSRRLNPRVFVMPGPLPARWAPATRPAFCPPGAAARAQTPGKSVPWDLPNGKNMRWSLPRNAMKMNDIKQTFVIGGLNITIRSPQNRLFLNDKRFDPFRDDASAADICWDYQMVRSADLILPPLDPEHDPLLARAWRIGSASPLLAATQVQARLEQTKEHVDWLVVEMHQGAVTILDFSSHRADMFFAPDFGRQLEQHGIGPAMLAPFLPKFDACLLHASAVVRNGRTAVFLAPDEGGKSTAVRLSLDGTILSDDQVLVRRVGESFHAWGTPWGLVSSSKTQTALGGFFLLQKAQAFSLQTLDPALLSDYLRQEHDNPLKILPEPLKQKAYSNFTALSRQVPAWKMSFAKDFIDWKAIDRAMEDRGK